MQFPSFAFMRKRNSQCCLAARNLRSRSHRKAGADVNCICRRVGESRWRPHTSATMNPFFAVATCMRACSRRVNRRQSNAAWNFCIGSNQLNLTTNRYTVEEFHCLLANPLVLSVATSCQDKFGDYGIVGFASITLEDTPLLTDFVFSCRVAKKNVENAWIQYMADFMRGASYTKVRAIYIPTKRNGILLEVLQEAGVVEVGQQGRNLVLELSLDRPVEGSDIATVTDAGVRPLGKSALTKTV